MVMNRWEPTSTVRPSTRASTPSPIEYSDDSRSGIESFLAFAARRIACAIGWASRSSAEAASASRRDSSAERR